MATCISVLRPALLARLQRGQHLVLFGPRGSGKSALLSWLHERLSRGGMPCGFCERTSTLNDITRAFEQAYPTVSTATTSRRNARARLLLASEDRPGVLLLDHLSHVSTAMLGFMRRLRGGPLGVLMAVDVDVERERERLRRWHLGTMSVSMPPTPPRNLRRLFRAHCAGLDIPPLTPRHEREMVRAARGRPGWILRCAGMIGDARYWRGDTLYASVLCADTEIALRLDGLAGKMVSDTTFSSDGPP